MMLTLAWKEYREHRSVWLTMVLMTGLLGFVLGQLASSQGSTATFGMGMLALTGAYGVVCGAMMLAGEREGGTLVLLDIFLGRRGLLWLGKFALGIPLAITEGLAVALIMHFLKLPPPEWMAAVLGQGSHPMALAQPQRFFEPTTALWFWVLPLVAVEAFAWGLLGSAITQRVLTGAAVSLLMATPVWATAICLPPEGFFGIRMLALVVVLIASCSIFFARSEFTMAPPPPEPVRDPRVAVIREIEAEIYFDRPLSESHGRDLPLALPVGLPLALPVDVPWTEREVRAAVDLAMRVEETPQRPRRVKPPPQAESPQQVLFWLTFRQAAVPCTVLGVLGILLGFLVPNFGQVIWPLATLLIGVGCGTAAFAWEQSDLSYQFLAAQHFPLRTVWNVKIGFWFMAALLGAVVVACGGALFLTLIVAASRHPANAGVAGGFRFGTFPELLGWPLFIGMWLVYGFCVGQVFVLLCRKPVYAVMLSALVSAGILGLWLPSLLGQGMSGWQVWLPPLVMLAATRALMRAWAGGRIKERGPTAALVGFGAGMFAWIAVHLGWQAVSVPDVGEPFDRPAFRAGIASGPDNPAGQKILDAVAEMEDPKGKEGKWLAKMAEAAKLPPGVLETPSSEGQAPILRHLPGCRMLTHHLGTLTSRAISSRDLPTAWQRITEMLALSRSLRHKAPMQSYLDGIHTEAQALDRLEQWLSRGLPSAQLLRQALDDLNRHAEETPAALDCLQTECYRAGGLLANPTMWSFHSGTGRVPERWLADSIAFSLDTPWEKERITRIWRALWAGRFRLLETPHWQLPKALPSVPEARESTRRLMQGWLPAADGRVASLDAPRLARLLDASWLSDDGMAGSPLHLHRSGTRSRARVDGARLLLALSLYQVKEGKTAAKLDDLVPNYLPEVPIDSYSGVAFGYRRSGGERIAIAGAALPHAVERGQAILWSDGPDGIDDGARADGRNVPDGDARWEAGGIDLVVVVPRR